MVRTRATIFSSFLRAGRSPGLKKINLVRVHPDFSEQSGAPHYSDLESFRNLSAVLTQACQREAKIFLLSPVSSGSLGYWAAGHAQTRRGGFRFICETPRPRPFPKSLARRQRRLSRDAKRGRALRTLPFTCIVTTFALPQSRTPSLSAHWAIKRGRYRSCAMDVKIFRHWIIALCVLGFFAVPASIAKSPTNEADCKNAGKIWLNERQKCVPIRISERPRSTARTVLGLVGLGCALGGLILTLARGN